MADLQERNGAVMKIGYFIPEFPGQTHAFFWRELQALQECGLRPDLVSSRPPRAGAAAHEWALTAASRTQYLVPLRMTLLIQTLAEILRAGPMGWLRVVSCLVADSDLSLVQRLKQIPLAFLGAALSALGRKGGWDHIHVHSCANAANVAMYANRLSGLPYSLTLHGPLQDYGPNQRNKWKHSAFAIVITRQLAREVQEQLCSNLPSVVRIAPMGVQVDRFVRSAEYAPCEQGDEVRLMSCGRLNPCKGHDDLIRTIAILHGRGIKASLRIAGAVDSNASDHHKELRDLARVHEVASHVDLMGSVSEQEVRENLGQVHIFALASMAEPLGVATMEAMAMGVPVVATRGGGVTELVRDGEDGLLVDARQPEQIADAVEHLIANPDEATRLGQAARRRIEVTFHHRVSAETLAQCLGIAVESTAPPQPVARPVSQDDIRDIRAGHRQYEEAALKAVGLES